MPPEPAPAAFVGAIITAVRSFDQRKVRAALDQASHLFGIGVALDEVALPSLRVMETFRSNGAVDVSHVHALSIAVNRWVTGRAALAPAPSRSGSIMLVAGPADQHTVALDCLDLLLTQRGVEVFNLGAQTPGVSVALAARTVRPGAVVVMSNTPTAATLAVRCVIEAAEAGYPVYYSGSSFSSQYDRQAMPGNPLDESLAQAASVLVARHTSDGHTVVSAQRPNLTKPRASV